MAANLLGKLGGRSIVAGLVALSAAVPATAAPVQHGATRLAAAHHDTSPPLRDIKPAATPQGHRVAPVRRLPRPAGSGGQTGAIQRSASRLAAPATVLNFNGIGNGFTGPAGNFTVQSAPPDPNAAVGPNHIVEIVNTDFAVFNKSGTAVFGPVPINTLWSGFGGGCQTNNDGDATVSYDRIADRWVIQQFSVSTTPYLECVAVSQTPDPTGAYNRYSFQYTDFPDYPKLAVWPDAYYVTYNMFAGGSTFSGGTVCALDRAKMIAGQAATQQCFSVGSSYGGLLPSDVDGATQPPPGSPDYVVALGANANELAYWKFHVDWATPGNTTLTGPTALATAAFSDACGGGTCIPQSGTTQQLDSLADRLMYRLAYRNFGDHEALVVNHSVTAGSSTGVRWYELRPDSSHNLSIFQQGTYAPDSNYRWMGSIAQDQSGDMALGFSVSSASLHPEIHYTGRLAGDAAGQMTQGEGTIINGAGSQTGSGLSRWGDYSSMSIDPSDDCTFFYTQQYIPANGAFNWSTRIGSFKFPGCGATPSNDFSISANPTSLTLAAGAGGSSSISTAVTSGSAGTVNLSVSGAPSGATATLNPTSVTAGSGSTLSVNAGTAAAGNYTLTVTGTEGTATHSATVNLTVTSTSGGGIVNGGFETGSLSGWTTSGASATVINSGCHGGTYCARVGSTTPTNGDSNIAQTFTAPAGGTGLSFWYKVVCPDTITYDWATATLRDNTASTTATILAKTCSNSGAWVQATGPVTAGHSYTLTLTSHDDNYPGDPTYTLYDDVTITTPAPPSNDFSISANPTSLTLAAGAGGSSSISTAVTSGSAGTVNLSVSGAPSGATATLNPTSVTAGSGSTLSVNAGTAAAGNYTLTVTGTEGTATHSATVNLTVTSTSGGGIVNGGFETGSLSGWTTSGASATVINSGCHGGTYCARVGSTTPTNGDSNIAQTFTAPAGGTGLSFWYKVVCPDTITYDWATATLRDNTASTTATILAKTCSNSGAWVQATGPVTAGHSYTLTLTSHDDNYPGDPTYTLYDDVTITTAAPPPAGIVNGGFETGSLSGWTTSGASATVINSGCHGGTYCARVGSTTPTNGDSNIAQTFTAPAGGTGLSFWYKVVCPDTITYDWATATLRDNTASTTATILAKTCSNSGAWVQATGPVTAGHSYTLTLTSHDDNYPGDPTYTLYDDVTIH